MKSRIMYIELKTHGGRHNDRGPARIGRVFFNRTGKTITYKDKKFQKGGTDSCANYHDIITNEGYWISGPKKNGQDRHSCGGGPIAIDEDVRVEYWTVIREQPGKVDQKFT
ncbi:MAG: 1-deoxy-D-xylulose-5-phosphate synthase [Phycisphaerales bacterium]